MVVKLQATGAVPMVSTTTLRYGSRGPHVRHLQQLLNKCLHPTPNLPGNDRFGPRTDAAVRLYQASLGLTVTGVVGPTTWGALEKGLAGGHRALGGPLPVSSQQPPWMAIARQEVGQKERRGKSNNNPRIMEYHAATSYPASSDEDPWCSSFVNWCLKQAGIRGTTLATAESWMHWGKPCAAMVGAITIIHTPKGVGSRISGSGNHVGFLVAETESYLILLGGNQGDQVRESQYKKLSGRVITYRWPKP